MTDRVDDMTKRLLVDAGVVQGMSVIDIGCGRGDVTQLVSRLVGNTGYALGVDRDKSALALATERAKELGLTNTAFAEGDFSTAGGQRQLDAVVGRRVLMYQSNPAAAIREIARALRPGGLVVFQEHDATMTPAAIERLPLHYRVHGWIWRTVEREGGNLHMGFQLASALQRAGLTVEHVRAEAVVQTPDSPLPTAAVVRAMLSRIVQQGVASEAEIDIETLDTRLSHELKHAGAAYVGDMVFGAYARKPLAN